MQLRSGDSYWRAWESPAVATASLVADLQCEVAVVGGGITGALVAYLLLQNGVDTVLIDKREPAIGSTAASTGLLQYEVDKPLCDLIGLVGETSAVHAYRRGLRAIDELEQLVADLGDGCGFSRRDSLYFATRRWHRRRLRREFECRQLYSFDVQLLERSDLRQISSIDSSAAILSRGDAQVDPYRLTLCLLRRAHDRGLKVFANTEVDSVEADSNGVTLRTATVNVRADKVVFAIGYESQRFLNQRRGNLNCTYVAVSQPLESFTGWPDEALIWETARPYFYARQTDDGRAMIGGGDTAFAADHRRDGLVERKVRQLKRRFEQLFPALVFEPQYAWAGSFGETNDGLAYIGAPPDQPHAYFALGYGGNGITFSMIAARLITDLYCGRANADQPVFGFNR